MKQLALAFAVTVTLLAGSGVTGAKAAISSGETARSRGQGVRLAAQRASASRARFYQGVVVGDRRTNRFHHPSDPRKPEERRRVYFHSPAAARAAGYQAVQPWRLPIPSLPKREAIGRSPASPLYPDLSKTAPTRPDPDW
jgi:hypothetical protein